MHKSESEVAQSSSTLHDPMDVAYQAPMSMGFSRQGYWSGVPLPSLRNESIKKVLALSTAEKKKNLETITNALARSNPTAQIKISKYLLEGNSSEVGNT